LVFDERKKASCLAIIALYNMLLQKFGVLLLVCTLNDILLTVISVSTNGSITRSILYLLPRAAAHFRWLGVRKSIVRDCTGFAALMSVTFAWVAALWCAWTLIFTADTHWIVATTGGQPANVIQ
jgi:hypothetical protein